MELSLCMIVCNEEARLGQCLESAKEAADEIIIVDTGSQDATKAVAARYTDRVYDYAWQDDFAAARNFSMEKATKPYILWLDADDVLDGGECAKLMALKPRLNGQIDAVMMPYHYAFGPNGKPSLVFDRERIVRRGAGFVFSGRVHEAMAVSGHVIRENIVVRHTGTHGARSNRRNLAIYEAMLAHGEPMSGRDRYYYARELKSAGETARAEAAFRAFLEGDGWIENRIDAQIQRGECLAALGRRAQAKEAFLLSMAEDVPRAQALCALGGCFLEEGNLHAAAQWYRAALLCQAPEDTRAFDCPDAYGYVPLMQLCVIYSRMGDEQKACAMNEQALLLRPGDGAALSNRAYFSAKLGAKKGRQQLEKTGWGE